MLREVVNVHQQDAPLRRRWFCVDYFDICVWESLESGRAIVGLQLCYDKAQHERVLSWRESTGYAHLGIDGGEPGPATNMSPIMVADGVLPLPDVLKKFDACAVGLDTRIRDFIREKLLKYGLEQNET